MASAPGRPPITIGTGSSDRPASVVAAYNGHQSRPYVAGYDVNISALYSVSVTSTGKVIIPPQANTRSSDDGFLELVTPSTTRAAPPTRATSP